MCGGEHWARFIPVGKLTPAHRAGPPTVRGRWVCPAWWVSASATAACPPTRWGTFYCPWAVGESPRPVYMATHRAGHFSLSLSGGWTSGSWIFILVLSCIPQLLILHIFFKETVSLWHSTPLWCLVFILWLSLYLYLKFFPPSGSQLRWNQIEKMPFCLRIQLKSNRLWKLDHKFILPCDASILLLARILPWSDSVSDKSESKSLQSVLKKRGWDSRRFWWIWEYLIPTRCQRNRMRTKCSEE